MNGGRIIARMPVTWESSYGAALSKARERKTLLMADFFSPH